MNKEKENAEMENEYEEELTIGEQDARYADEDEGITELQEQRQRMSWRKR